MQPPLERVGAHVSTRGDHLRPGTVPLEIFARHVDVAARDQMQAFAEEVHAESGPVDLLVNNAGVAVTAEASVSYGIKRISPRLAGWVARRIATAAE